MLNIKNLSIEMDKKECDKLVQLATNDVRSISQTVRIKKIYLEDKGE